MTDCQHAASCNLSFRTDRVDSQKLYCSSSGKAKYKLTKEVPPRTNDADHDEPLGERIEPVYSNLPSKRAAEKVIMFGNSLRSAGSRAPVCVDDVSTIDLSIAFTEMLLCSWT